jgi:hypothetical protein
VSERSTSSTAARQVVPMSRLSFVILRRILSSGMVCIPEGNGWMADRTGQRKRAVRVPFYCVGRYTGGFIVYQTTREAGCPARKVRCVLPGRAGGEATGRSHFGLCNAALRTLRTLRMRSDATSVPIPSPLYSLLAPRAGADDALVRPLMMSEPKV